MRNFVAGVIRRSRRIWYFKHIERAVRGKHGLEIGGPSWVFSPTIPNGYLPSIYALAESIDNCNFASATTWSHGEAGRTFRYLADAEPGLQYIHDATDLSSIADDSYDFVIASHILEHVANPLRALEEFCRVLKPGGSVLVLVPDRKTMFDHKRPFTTMAHLKEDWNSGRDEHDQTHLEEILALHDLAMDAPAGTITEFRERCLRNFENRCMHHHVFSLDLLEEAFRFVRLRPVYRLDRFFPHLVMLGRKV